MFSIKCPPISFPSLFCNTADSSSGKQISISHPFACNVVTAPLCYVSVYFSFLLLSFLMKIDQMCFSLGFLRRKLMCVVVFKCLCCGSVEWPLLYQVTIQHKQKNL